MGGVALMLCFCHQFSYIRFSIGYIIASLFSSLVA
jgi:hypothetical protein